MSNSDLSSSDDEHEVRQPKVQSPFSVQDDMFPAFGGQSQQVAPTLNFSSAWASSAAPEAMPEVVVRRKPRPQQPSSSPANPEAAPSSSSSVPWGSMDAAPTRWSGAAPRGFQGIPHDDPYAVVFQGPPRRAKAAAGLPPAPAPAPAPAPVPEKRPKASKKAAGRAADDDGFTEVAVRVRHNQESKESKGSAPKGPGLGAKTAFAALQDDAGSFEPKSKPSKPSKPEPPKKESKKKQGSNKEKKQQQQPKPAAEKPKESAKPKTKSGSSKSKTGSKKGSESTPGSNKAAGGNQSSFHRGVFFGVLLALQYGMQPLLTKECIHQGVNKSSIVVSQEILKLLITPAILLSEQGPTGFTSAFSKWSLKSTLQVALLPAGIYAVQNYCLFYSAAHMDPLVFNLVNQTKLVWTALFVYLVLGKPQSRVQLVALLMLMLSAILLTTAPPEDDKESTVKTSMWHGIVPNLVAAVLSGLAAALTQYATQSPALGRSGYLFTMELCVFQLGWYLLKEGYKIDTGLFFTEWTPYTILPILCNALGGIFTGQVVQHLGAVKKTFAVIAALILTSIFRSVYYENAPLSSSLFIALPLVLTANYLYSNYPPESAKKPPKKKKSQ